MYWDPPPIRLNNRSTNRLGKKSLVAALDYTTESPMIQFDLTASNRYLNNFVHNLGPNLNLQIMTT